MLVSTFHVLKQNFPVVGGAFLLVFFSVFGQTGFIGVFLPELREHTGLSQSELGGYYGLATLLSGLALIWSGKKLDHMPLLRFLNFVIIGLALGAFTLALAPNALFVFLAFFVLRHFGQGLMVLSGNTAINRYMDKNRGKAMAVLALAAPVHIAIFPPLALFLLNFISWKSLWIAAGVFSLVILMPLFYSLLKNHQRSTHALWEQKIKNQEEQASQNGTTILNKTRMQVLKDWRFYALLAAVIVQPFNTTAIFFFQADIASVKNISQLAFTSSFTPYMIFSLFTALISGILIDKFGEAPSLIMQSILYFIGLLALVMASGLPGLYISLAMIGASEGFARTTGGPVLARLFGTKYLGAVKSMMFSTLILSSALAPVLVGFLMDQDVALMTQFSFFAAYSVLAFCLLIPLIVHLTSKKD